MKYDRKKKIPTSKERQQHASRRNARATKVADSLAQLDSDDPLSAPQLINKLKRNASELGDTSPPKW
jgi:hypothetical protein